MKQFDDDKKLRSLMKDIKLEKPGLDFTTNVMNRVFEIRVATLQAVRLHILDWKFWVLVSLFVGFAVVMVFYLQTGAQPETSVLPELNTGKVAEGYHSFLGKVNELPLSIAAILTASSLLVFLDRFLTRKKQG